MLLWCFIEVCGIALFFMKIFKQDKSLENKSDFNKYQITFGEVAISLALFVATFTVLLIVVFSFDYIHRFSFSMTVFVLFLGLVDMIILSYIGFQKIAYFDYLSRLSHILTVLLYSFVFTPLVLLLVGAIIILAFILFGWNIDLWWLGIIALQICAIALSYYYLNNLRKKIALFIYGVIFLFDIIVIGFFVFLNDISMIWMVTGVIFISMVFVGIFVSRFNWKPIPVTVILMLITVLLTIVIAYKHIKEVANYRYDNMRELIICEAMSDYWMSGNVQVRVVKIGGVCVSSSKTYNLLGSNSRKNGFNLLGKETMYYIPNGSYSTMSGTDSYGDNKVVVRVPQLGKLIVFWKWKSNNRATVMPIYSKIRFLGGQYLTDGQLVYYGSKPTKASISLDSFQYLGGRCARDNSGMYYQGHIANKKQCQF